MPQRGCRFVFLMSSWRKNFVSKGTPFKYFSALRFWKLFQKRFINFLKYLQLFSKTIPDFSAFCKIAMCPNFMIMIVRIKIHQLAAFTDLDPSLKKSDCSKNNMTEKNQRAKLNLLLDISVGYLRIGKFLKLFIF